MWTGEGGFVFFWKVGGRSIHPIGIVNLIQRAHPSRNRSPPPQVDAFTEILPNAAVYHIGMFSNHSSSLPIQYYNRLPKDKVSDLTFVLDPLIATGAFWSAWFLCM